MGYIDEKELTELLHRVLELEAERDRLREVVREQAEACERMAWECRMGITDGEPSLHEVEAALRAALEVK